MITFSSGDIIYVPRICSLHSMVYYGEHREEKLSCPCSWTHTKGRVSHSHGNFVHVEDLVDSTRKTAFYHSDITLIQRAGVEDVFD